MLPRVRKLEESADQDRGVPAGPTLGEFYSAFRGLAGLRGLWYSGACDQAGAVYDASGQGRTLTMRGNPVLRQFLATNRPALLPHFDYDGTGDWHDRADEAGLDVIGNEASIASDTQGLTCGIWFRPESFTNDGALIGKNSNAAFGDSNYDLRLKTTGTVSLEVYNGGVRTLSGDSAATSVSGWYFAVGRWQPSAELAVYVNGTWVRNITSIPATLTNSAQVFRIGAHSNIAGGGAGLNIRWALAFLCGAWLHDDIIRHLFNRTRVHFGV